MVVGGLVPFHFLLAGAVGGVAEVLNINQHTQNYLFICSRL
jgi:phage shock protein PspC (stress-responsive transcriptional regulator)